MRVKSIHDAIKREQKKLSKSDASPSKTYEAYWIYAERKIGTYPQTTDRGGKYLLFIPVAHIDNAWQTVRKAVEDGKLGNDAKVSTMKPNPNAFTTDVKVICVYTYDSNDEEDVLRIRDVLKTLGMTRGVYKTDQSTLQMKYSVYGDTNIALKKYNFGPSSYREKEKAAKAYLKAKREGKEIILGSQKEIK